MISAQITRDIYLYCRTKRAIEHSQDDIRPIFEALPLPPPSNSYFPDPMLGIRGALLSFDPATIVWPDGFVIRLRSLRTPLDLASDMATALSGLDAWALHDGHGAFAEHPGGGPLSRFAEQLWGGEYQELLRRNLAQQVPVAQLFLVSRDSDSRFEETVANIRSAMRGDSACLPVFHLRNGRILFANSAEPGRILIHRCEQHLTRLARWAVLDSDGRSFSAQGEDETIWCSIDDYLDGPAGPPDGDEYEGNL